MATEILNHAEAVDRITGALAKARAMLAMTYGSGAGFRELSEDMQDDYLWSVAELVDKAYDHAGQLAGGLPARATPAA